MEKYLEKNRIVILSATGGVDVSARAIKQQVESQYNDCEVLIVYRSEYTGAVQKTVSSGFKKISLAFPAAVSAFSKIKYNRLIKESKKNTVEKQPINISQSLTLIRNIYNRLLPKLIISTDLDSHVLSLAARKKFKLSIPVINIYPLLFTDKRFMLNSCNGFAVGSEDVKAAFLNAGIDADKVNVTGLSSFAKFSDRFDKAKLKEQLNLNENQVVLINAFGMSFNQIKNLNQDIILNNGNINIIVVTGKNESLKEKLDSFIEKNGHENCKVFGYTTEMDILLKASDIFVFSGGTMSFIEAATVGIPSIVFSPTTFNEFGNVQYLKRHLFAMSAENSLVVAKKINSLLNNLEEYKSAVVNIKGYNKTAALKNIASFIYSYIQNN